MQRYNQKVFIWTVGFAVLLFGIAGTSLFSEYDNVVEKSRSATLIALTLNAPTATATLSPTKAPTYTPTITFTPTLTFTPTMTSTSVPCSVSLPGTTTLYAYPSFVNFNKNFLVKDVVALFRLKDEPWAYVKAGGQAGWIVMQQDFQKECSSLLEYSLASLQSVGQPASVLFEDTFEVQSIDWKISEQDSLSWSSSSLVDEKNRTWLNALTHGNQLQLPAQSFQSIPQIELNSPSFASEWTLSTSFQYASVGSDNYLGVRLISAKSENTSLEFRLHPSIIQCKYEVVSIIDGKANDKPERSGALPLEICKLGLKFQEPTKNSLLVPYGFLQLHLVYQPARQSVRISFSFNGSPLATMEITDPEQNFAEIRLGLTSVQVRSYLDYIVITGR